MATVSWGTWAWQKACQSIPLSCAAKAGNNAIEAINEDNRDTNLQKSAGYAAVAGVINEVIPKTVSIPTLVAGGALGSGLTGLKTAIKKPKTGCLQMLGAGLMYASSYAPEKLVTTAAQVYTVASMTYVLGKCSLQKFSQGKIVQGTVYAASACACAATLGVFAYNLISDDGGMCANPNYVKKPPFGN